ncbi:MAG: diphthine--ammonia ligase [Vicinamibacterales bacterium]
MPVSGSPASPRQPDRPRAAISWSGGKDCCLALLRARTAYDVCAAITMFAEDGNRSRSHGLRPEVLQAQAERLGLTTLSGRCSWETYTDEYIRVLGEVAALGITHVIFGDIMFDAHAAWNRRVCAAHGLTAVMPLWGEPTDALLAEFLGTGSRAMVVTSRTERLDPAWLGRTLDAAAHEELTTLGVDPCGEQGEYHTLVVDSPVFSSPLPIQVGARVEQGPCWALDVTLVEPVAC